MEIEVCVLERPGRGPFDALTPPIRVWERHQLRVDIYGGAKQAGSR